MQGCWVESRNPSRAKRVCHVRVFSAAGRRENQQNPKAAQQRGTQTCSAWLRLPQGESQAGPPENKATASNPMPKTRNFSRQLPLKDGLRASERPMEINKAAQSWSRDRGLGSPGPTCKAVLAPKSTPVATQKGLERQILLENITTRAYRLVADRSTFQRPRRLTAAFRLCYNHSVDPRLGGGL
jgi:hypothetical protein